MTAALLFQFDEAIAAIRSCGMYSVEDAVVGARVHEFSNLGFPTKSPFGLEFLAQNSNGRDDIREVNKSMLTTPHWGLIKIYGDILPAGNVYRFHNGSTEEINTILVQLWSPGSEVVIFDGSVARTIDADTIDHKTSKEWGLLAASEHHFKSPIEKSFKLGGLVLSDSRLGFAIRRGYAIFIGFATKEEVQHWGKMPLPYSDQMEKKIQSLQDRGHNINYCWIDQDTTQ